MEDALKRCSERGLIVNSVIDIGASDGRWSNICMKYLPNAQYLLIEAQEAHRQALEMFKAENNQVTYVIAAAGSKEGSVYFDNTGLFGGIASDIPFEYNCIEVPEITIDQEIKRSNMQPPFLIKLDTHGFEKYIIEGALETIKNTELIIIETYNYQLTKNSLKFYQICDYMEKLGFSTIEMVDFSLRNYDNSFWQMDTFFIRSSSKEFSYNSYK
jgi:FkbM family methyltransferase